MAPDEREDGGRPAFDERYPVTRCPLPGGAVMRLATDRADRMIGAAIRGSGIWQPEESRLVAALLGPGDCAVDAGAHVGYFTVLMSRMVGRRGKVWAFEPEPDNFALLQANVRRNRCGNVTLARVALGGQTGSATLFLARGNLGDHRLHRVDGRAAIAVSVRRLDDGLDGGRIDFMKIDTQGSEAGILSGAAGTIAASQDRLLCLMEFSPQLSDAAGWDRRAFFELLAHLGAVVMTATLPPRPVPRVVVERLWDQLHAASEDDAHAMLLLAFSEAAARRAAAIGSPPRRTSA